MVRAYPAALVAALVIATFAPAAAQQSSFLPDYGLKPTWTIDTSYGTFNPSAGTGAGQSTFQASYLAPLGGPLAVNLHARYDGISGAGGVGTKSTSGDAAFDFHHALPFSFRAGVNVGFQSIVMPMTYIDDYDYEGYFDDDFCDDVDGYVFGGGFSTIGPGFSQTGSFIGGGINGYITPNFGVHGQIDQAWFVKAPASSSTDYSLNLDLQVSNHIPLVGYAGYTYTTFSPGTFSVNTFSGGLRLYLGGKLDAPLVERERTGPLNPNMFFAPLQYKF